MGVGPLLALLEFLSAATERSESTVRIILEEEEEEEEGREGESRRGKGGVSCSPWAPPLLLSSFWPLQMSVGTSCGCSWEYPSPCENGGYLSICVMYTHTHTHTHTHTSLLVLVAAVV